MSEHDLAVSLSFTVLLWNCSVLRHRSPFYLLYSFLFFSFTHRRRERSTARVFKLHDKEVVKRKMGLPLVLAVLTEWTSKARFANRNGSQQDVYKCSTTCKWNISLQSFSFNKPNTSVMNIDHLTSIACQSSVWFLNSVN